MGHDSATQQWLEQYLREQRGMAGTVHRLVDGVLRLSAAVNIPDPVQRATETIPRGKGMAGQAWEQGRAISTCNLQDAGGPARPGARAVGSGAAVALPVRDAGDAVRAVVGIAFAEARELPDDELSRLADSARSLP